jgi:O-antigen ligase
VAARPWLGWGAAAFSVLYPIYAAKRWHGHSHNLPLELAISHGIPVTVLIVGTVSLLLVVALKRGILKQDPVERAWWAAALVMVVMHATDLPLFDSRMNFLGWVLLAGLANFNQPRKLDRDVLAVSGATAVL